MAAIGFGGYLYDGASSAAGGGSAAIAAQERSSTLGLALLAELLHLSVQDGSLAGDASLDGLHSLLQVGRKGGLVDVLGDDIHGVQNSTQLVRQPVDDGTTASGHRVSGSLDDVLLGEVPMPGTEVAHLVKDAEVVHGRDGVAQGELAHTSLLGLIVDMSHEDIVLLGAVRAEILENLRELVLGHVVGQLQQVIGGRDDGVISTRFATELSWALANDLAGVLGVVDLVPHAIGEHGLVLRAHDEDTEVLVVLRERATPHGVHFLVDLGHGVVIVHEGLVQGRTILLDGGIQRILRSIHNGRGEGNHGNMHKNKCRLARHTREGANRAKVVVGHALGRIDLLPVIETNIISTPD